MRTRSMRAAGGKGFRSALEGDNGFHGCEHFELGTNGISDMGVNSGLVQ